MLQLAMKEKEDEDEEEQGVSCWQPIWQLIGNLLLMLLPCQVNVAAVQTWAVEQSSDYQSSH